MKNTQSEIKPTKTRATYSFGCHITQDLTHNFRPQEVVGQISQGF